ncbi:hypothetical protein V757_02645 [Pelistega indica]|uniref:Ammonia monooxygenase n=1 Tax=Pelistega indica TaxID=1414851 RepID=V8G9B1_9BURK|nr:hypothetical protein V757_02645 [Pelistega indica]
MLATVATIFSIIISYVSGLDFATLLLVFLPGGAPEIGVMAMALDINPAIVTMHHMLRVLIIIVLVSIFSSNYLKMQDIEKTPKTIGVD